MRQSPKQMHYFSSKYWVPSFLFFFFFFSFFKNYTVFMCLVTLGQCLTQEENTDSNSLALTSMKRLTMSGYEIPRCLPWRRWCRSCHGQPAHSLCLWEPRRDDRTHGTINASGGMALIIHTAGAISPSDPYCHFWAQANTKQWHLQTSGYRRIFVFARERQSLWGRTKSTV